MNRIELKPNIILEGFDDKREFDMKLHYLTFNAPSPYREGKIIPVLYEGKTSKIPEELAKECILAWFFGKEFDSFEDYNNRSNGFNTAKESIQSACNQEYCIIYKTY